MASRTRIARTAGFLYLLFVVGGFFDLYASSKLTVAGNAPATMHDILSHPLLFHFDVLANLLTLPIWLATAIALYMLLRDVNKALSRLMVILVLVQLPSIFISVTNQLVTIDIAQHASYLAAFNEAQRNGLGMLLVRINEINSTAQELFWGLWLFPLCVLVYKSRFLPRFLGIWLGLNGLLYVVVSVVGIFVPAAAGGIFKFAFPVAMGEVAFMLWLLIAGARKSPREPASSPGQRSDASTGAVTQA